MGGRTAFLLYLTSTDYIVYIILLLSDLTQNWIKFIKQFIFDAARTHNQVGLSWIKSPELRLTVDNKAQNI